LVLLEKCRWNGVESVPHDDFPHAHMCQAYPTHAESLEGDP